MRVLKGLPCVLAVVTTTKVVAHLVQRGVAEDAAAFYIGKSTAIVSASVYISEIAVGRRVHWKRVHEPILKKKYEHALTTGNQSYRNNTS